MELLFLSQWNWCLLVCFIFIGHEQFSLRLCNCFLILSWKWGHPLLQDCWWGRGGGGGPLMLPKYVWCVSKLLLCLFPAFYSETTKHYEIFTTTKNENWWRRRNDAKPLTLFIIENTTNKCLFLFLLVSLPMPCSHLHTCPFCSRLSLLSLYLQSPVALAFIGGVTIREGNV